MNDKILSRIGLYKYDRIVNTIKKYQKWLNDLTPEERGTDLEHWIKDQIRKLDAIINNNL